MCSAHEAGRSVLWRLPAVEVSRPFASGTAQVLKLQGERRELQQGLAQERHAAAATAADLQRQLRAVRGRVEGMVSVRASGKGSIGWRWVCTGMVAESQRQQSTEACPQRTRHGMVLAAAVFWEEASLPCAHDFTPAGQAVQGEGCRAGRSGRVCRKASAPPAAALPAASSSPAGRQRAWSFRSSSTAK